MSLSIIGFPRIGANRELKFATEKYFKQEISEKELTETAKQIRLENWQAQKENQINFPVSNDFSFYDQVLDTSFFLNAIPKRYQELQLNPLETYFALARGFQDETRDVKALPMKKWFNTNYHYLVPELDNPTDIKADTIKIISEFSEAKTAGFTTKPVIVGPYTFLKLADFTNNTNIDDYVEAVTTAYITLLEELEKIGATWLQIDEPALVLDQTATDIALFEKLYQPILANKNELKVLLQTYFGDIRDSYQAVIALDFDSYGLDFIEGKETLNLIKQYGFPENKSLVAGVVNGKNIWRNDYQKTLTLLTELPKNIEVTIGSSCSLQHVPVTTASENNLSNDVLKHFAFAVEKLSELKELNEIYFNKNTAYLESNKELFNGLRTTKNIALETKIKNFTQADFTRLPDALERRETQTGILNLPILPTTTIGSFPQTQEIRRERLAYKRQEISKETYEAFLEYKTTEVIKWQDNIGLDVLVHGEFERNDMVEYFGEQLDGYIFTQKAWVQSYGTRCVKPPIIWGDITRPHEMTVRWTAFAQKQTTKPVKGMLTGPVTILNWSFPREDVSIKESTLQIALAIQEEVLDLEKAGIKIIQIDEAALREKLPLRQSDWFSEYLDWTIPAFRLVHAKVQPQTQIHTHMCYSEFKDIIEAIDNMDADVISFEASRSDLSILDSLKKHHFRTLVGPGVYDIHSPRIPSVEEIKHQITKIAEKIPTEQIWINPDCGLKTRGNKETSQSLENLVRATQEFRKEHQLDD